MPIGLSGLYRNTRGAKEAHKRGEFPNTNPYGKSLAQIRREAYEDGYADAMEEMFESIRAKGG